MLKKKAEIASPLLKKDTMSQIGASATMVGILSSFATFAFADNTKTLSDALLAIINGIGTLLNQIFSPLCVLILGIAIVVIIIGKDSKSADSGIHWAKRAVVGFVLFNILGSVLTYGTNLLEGFGYNWTSSIGLLF